MMKGLMDNCLSHEKTLERVCSKANAMKAELTELKSWRIRHEEKLKLSEQVRGELEKQVELLGKALKDKEESPR